MIFYLSDYSIGELIKDIVSDTDLVILNHVEAEKINLEHTIKKQTNILDSASIIIVQLSILENSDEEIVLQLNNLRFMYNSRIVVIAKNLANRELLSNIFELGIYDIVIENEYSIVEEEDEINLVVLKQKIKKAIIQGYSYAESAKFRIKEDTIKQQNIKEKVIIKKEVLNNVHKAMIGLMGMQDRIGTTHNAILSAYFLKKQGYKVAVVESNMVTNKSFDKIQEYTTDVIEHQGYFEINGIDFYKDYNISEIHKILIKNYNFVVIDFGLFDKEKLVEFNRCIISIILSGSKSWEIDNMFNLFNAVPEEELKVYTYLFSFTDQETAKNVVENMEDLEKIYFAEYLPKLFESPESITLTKIFSRYIKEKDAHKSLWGNFIEMVKKKK